MELAGSILSFLYDLVCALLVLYGMQRTVVLAAHLRERRRPHPEPPAPVAWPTVTVQLPVFNERYVVRRLLEAVSHLDYPRDRLEIQILDDSTDCTARLLRRLTAVLRRRGIEVQHLHRCRRHGYKAGALAAGLRRARGELVALFDADFVPPPDFLRRAVPHVLQPGVGAVQARWGHLNRDTSWFTRLQAVLLDGHFVIEQPARSATGCFLSFNGTCGVWRRAAIAAAGGWSSATLTEDLDLSLRAQLHGWRILYLPDVVVPGELPEDPNSFRSQQRRWTRGGVQVARRMLPRILRAPLPLHVKVEAFFHLTCYAAHPLLLLLALLRMPVRVLGQERTLMGLLPWEIELLCIGTLPLIAFYALAAWGSGDVRRVWRCLALGLPAMALGAGLAISNTRAVLEGLCGRDLTFERTPKPGGRPAAVRRPAAYRSPRAWIAVVEVMLLVYLLLWKVLGTGTRAVTDVPFLMFFGFGLLALALPSLGGGRLAAAPWWRMPANNARSCSATSA